MTIEFELVPEDSPLPVQPPECQHGCHSLKWTELHKGHWSMDIEEGDPTVFCSVCHCVFEGLQEGREPLFTIESLPVLMEFQSECTGSHRESPWCDCNWYFNITPRKD